MESHPIEETKAMTKQEFYEKGWRGHLISKFESVINSYLIHLFRYSNA